MFWKVKKYYEKKLNILKNAGKFYNPVEYAEKWRIRCKGVENVREWRKVLETGR